MLPFIYFIDDNVYFMHSWASIHADAAGIGIPASSISVRYRSIPVLNWVPIITVWDWFRYQLFCWFRYRTDWMPDSPAFRHLKKTLYKSEKGCIHTPRTSTLQAMDWNASCTVTLLVEERGTLHLDPDPESGSAIRKNAGSGSALNQCGSESLLKIYTLHV
jgi:hypothetical protein